MAVQVSFSEIYKKLVERKKWEKNSQEKLEVKTCKCCHQNLIKNGMSKIDGVCSICVSASME